MSSDAPHLFQNWELPAKNCFHVMSKDLQFLQYDFIIFVNTYADGVELDQNFCFKKMFLQEIIEVLQHIHERYTAGQE